MSFKTLFDKASGIKSLANKSAEEIGNEIESVGYHTADILQEQRFIPQVDFTKPESFARFGSAEEYYVESVDRITEQFPYDGSLKERLDWENDSTYIDLHIYNNLYPRTTGYITMSIDPAVSNRVDGYGVPDVAEYISLKGGPHTNQDSGMNPYSTNFTGSNYLESSKNRESNLKYDLSGSGVSLEFWLKKDNFDTNTTHKEVIFDLWNGQPTDALDYGRLRLELTASGELDGTPGAGGRDAFILTVLSGTTGFVSSSITSENLTTSSIADGNWHHYAVSLLSGSDGVSGSFYVDGELENQFVSGALRVDIDGVSGDKAAINEVTGALSAYIGALRAPISGATIPGPTAASYGKLAASLDEFRYWKTQRSSKDIGRFWFTQVGGGTNTDTTPFSIDSNREMVNTQLGVYYKFNEGITGDTSIDSVVLDFSGRVTNGAWTGYTSASRNTGSAIISSSAATKEYEDPIIYSFHPLVTTLRDNLELSGSSYDVINNSSLYNSVPAWITEADMEGQKQLRYLTQIMGSYFDTLQLQMETLNKFKDISYVSSSEKPLPFAEKMLNSAGFVSPEIFLDADILEVLGDRSEDIVYEKSLNDIKNIVYKNIYNNLTYIFKSKGTEKAFRNLIRCFGIDDELVKLNLYATDTVYRYRENRRNVVVADKTVNFNKRENMGGVVYNASSSVNVDGFPYIPANTFLTGGYATTLETDVYFPLKAVVAEDTYINTNLISSSLFGLHRTAELADDPAWDPAGDNANFQVYAIRDEIESANAHFLLTGVGATLIPPLTSSLYEDLYDNNSWQLAVSIKPLEYSLVPYISSSTTDPTTRDDYLVVFRGVQTDSGEIINSFTVTGAIDSVPTSFLTSSRRTYVGAHRTNFTGTLLDPSDVRINSSRYWLNYLDDAALTAHAYDTENHGALYPHKYAYPFDPTASFGEILNFDTLMFNWEFSQNTGSDAYGIFQVADESSGSSQFMSASSYTSGAFGLPGKLLNKKYTAQGYGFEASNTGSIRKEHVISSKLNPLEVINSVDQVKVLSVQEHQEFYLDSRPVNYFFSFEKSMYRTISEEIVNYFGTLRDFNNIIGEPVNRYRPNYKLMALLRKRFFAQVSNSEIDFDKFYEFYKWFDSSLSYMLGQLVPVSADFAENIRTMIESHELERNKYKSVFQFMDEEKTVFEAALQSNVDYGGAISSPDDDKSLGFWPSSAPTRRQLGLSTRALTKVWEDTSAPVEAGVAGSALVAQEQRYLWWKNKIERTSSALAVPFSDDFNRSRVRLFDTIKQTIDRQALCPYRFSIEGNRTLGGVGSPAGQKVNFVFAATTPFGPEVSDYLEKVMVAKRSDLELLLNTTDRFYGPNFKQRLGLTFNPSFNTPATEDSLKYTGANLSPFSVYSSSVSTGYVADIASNYTGGIDFTNLHHDFVANTDVPLQGPFPEKFVGGRFYRHVDVSDGTDTMANRPEGFRIQFDGAKNPSTPKSFLFDGADEYINIGNAATWEALIGGAGAAAKAFSFSFWAKPAAFDDSAPGFITFGHQDRGLMFLGGGTGPANSRVMAFLETGTSFGAVATAGQVAIDTWQHFTATYPGGTSGTTKIYINGSEASYDSQPLGAPSLIATADCVIGAGSINAGTTKCLAGNMCDVAVWDKELSSAEVLEIYGEGERVKLSSTSCESNLLSWWMLGNGDGDTYNGTVYDEVGGRPGTPVNFDSSSDIEADSPVFAPMVDIVAILPPNSRGTVAATDANIPRGNRFRDETAKRPFNIKNILMTTSSAGVRLSGTLMHSAIGNYQRNYQVVQTCGRTANDPYFRDQSFTFAARALASNQTVRGRFPLTESTLGVNPGFTEFELPERTGSNSNQTVIVNRFSSPGSYAVDSLGYMAPPAEELSVYNALPYRNLEVINYGLSGSASSDPSIAQSIAVIDQISKNRGLNQLSSLHCGQYGSDAAYGLITATSTRRDGGLGYVVSASWHKVNRNRKQRMVSGSSTGNGLYTGSVYDNLFVQHAIPRSFQQYAWVTASVTGNAIMSLQPPTCLSASTYSQFLTSSDAQTIAAGGKGPDAYINDFVGLRRLILDPVTASTHTLGFSPGPLSSYVNNDYIVANNLEGTFAGGIAFQALMLNRSGPYQYPTWKQTRLASHPVVRKLRKTNTISVVDSPPLLESGLGYLTRGKSANTFTDFTEQPLSSRHIPTLVVAEKRAGDETFQDEGVYQLSYGNNLDMFSHESLNNRLNLQISKKEIYDNPFVSMMEYFLSSKANLLVDYGERVYPAEKVVYRNIVRNRTNFTITGAFDPARTVAERANSQGHVITSSAAWFLREEENFTTVAPALSSREQGAGEGQSIQGRYGVPDSYDITASAQYNMRIPIGWNADRSALIYGGTTKWQVAEQSSRLPYVDYNNWVHQLRLKAKDYSIVPEFRISEHIADIIDDGGNPLIDNWRLDITGAEYPNSNVDRFFETYTNGEFCKLFKVVDDMLFETGTGDQKLKRNKISLQCNAAKKLLPYPDFYPIQQFQKLAQQFSQSYGPHIHTTASADTADIPLAAGYRAFLDPFFSPGIWFNTYKSGLGVGSYVLLVSGGSELDINDVAKYAGVNSANSAFPEGVINFGSGSILSCSTTASNLDYSPYRVPFEAIYRPQLLNTKIISGSYIYDNGVGSGSLSGNTDGTYTLNRVAWEGQGNDLYRMMADNTLSSIYDLFIENPVSFISNTQDKFSALDVTEGDVFAMTFNIQRSLDSTGSADRSKFEMYSRNTAFGPPVVLDDGTGVDGESYLEYSASTSPSTPCYINGTASVTVVATASFAGTPILSDLLASAEYIYSTQLESDSYSETAIGSWFAQTISESFNLSERLGQENSSRWMIQSKFETPVLNFADVNATTPAEAAHPIQPGSAQSITTKGMGHQYGRITKGDEGIDCYIDTPEFVVSPRYGRLTRPRSLAKLVGFPEGIKKKVGVLKNEVLLEEAVVVVPFIQLNTRRKFLTFPRARVKLNSYQNLLSAMDKYIFPPKFDFTRFKEIKPVLMYVFEFEHSLTQENLSSWWQGAFPGQPNVDCHLCGCTDTEFELKEVQIEEKELVDKILGCDQDLHWMVFKVKKRAARNFEKLRRSFVTDDLSDIPTAVGEYTYNWPYDNFSLVELVKIEQQVRWLSDEVDGAPCPDPEADTPTPSPAPQRSPSATPPSPLVVTGRGLPDPDTGRKAQTTEKPTTTTATTSTVVDATPRVSDTTVDPDAVLSRNTGPTLSETGETGADSTIKKPQDG
tara:strand:+ start:3284 stop:12988 length:9705 start_codon:yes stop_codon:yes gene_type:complete